MNDRRPKIGISAGDPSGIGPEVCVKALSNEEIYRKCRPLVVCDAGVIERIIGICKPELRVNIIQSPENAVFEFGTVDVLDLGNVDEASFSYNLVSEEYGRASFEYITKVINLAKAGEIDATVTGPINKESINKAGFAYSGHTEIFADQTGTEDFAMMLAEKNFRVIHVSTHVSLLEAIQRVKKERVLRVIQLANETLKTMGIDRPKIAVAGLNPHAGENGLFGREEIDEIIPAITLAKDLGIDADGPHPPDTIFPRLKGGLCDIVICMYHDQGHIPTKLLGFNYNPETQNWDNVSGVNITIGLPIIRVSVDHGVAFDKGGKNEANPESMIQAIEYAARLVD